MTPHKLPLIEVGYHLFAADSTEEFGAVRQVAPDNRPELVIYIENAGEFTIPLDVVQKVTEQKVIIDASRLPGELQTAIRSAHAQERPGL